MSGDVRLSDTNSRVLSSISVIMMYLFSPSYSFAAAFNPYSKEEAISPNLRCSHAKVKESRKTLDSISIRFDIYGCF